MTTPRDPDALLAAYLAEGMEVLPDRVVDAVLDEAHRTRQRAVFGPWRTLPMIKTGLAQRRWCRSSSAAPPGLGRSARRRARARHHPHRGLRRRRRPRRCRRPRQHRGSRHFRAPARALTSSTARPTRPRTSANR